MNREYLETEMYKYKKIDAVAMSLEEYGLKLYFKDLTLEDSRIKFRERSSSMTSCRSHYHNIQENFHNNYGCYQCIETDTLQHWKYSKCYEQDQRSQS